MYYSPNYRTIDLLRKSPESLEPDGSTLANAGLLARIPLFHLGMTYRVHESTAQRIVIRTEQRLLAADALDRVRLVSTESLATEAVVIVDASESPIELPKKTRRLLQWEKTYAHAKVPARD